MKNWKKYLALLAALLLVLSFVACGAVEENPVDPPVEQVETPTEAATEAPVEEATEAATEATDETTEAGADYSAYMGQWHSGSVTLNIEKNNEWSMEQNGDVFLTGKIVVNAEDGSLQLYDVEGTEAAKILMDSEKSLYAELYTEELYNRIEDFFFTREQTSASIGVEDSYVSEEVVVDEGSVDTGDSTEDSVDAG